MVLFLWTTLGLILEKIEVYRFINNIFIKELFFCTN